MAHATQSVLHVGTNESPQQVYRQAWEAVAAEESSVGQKSKTTVGIDETRKDHNKAEELGSNRLCALQNLARCGVVSMYRLEP